MAISHHLLSTHHTKSNAIPVKTVNCNASQLEQLLDIF